MKETIYTIPINEAFDTDCKCPVCTIENKLETEQIDYTLGPAMMEPDFRENSNKKGFCKAHYKMLTENSKALPLALVLQSHIKEQNDALFSEKISKKTEKKGLFSKTSEELLSAQKITEHIKSLNCSCVVCENIDAKMKRYLDNIIYIWKTQPEFREKFASKKGFCIPHFAKLLEIAYEELNTERFKEFYHTIVNIQEQSQNKMYEDISAFTRLFDHTSDKKASDDVKSSIKNSIQMLTNYQSD